MYMLNKLMKYINNYRMFESYGEDCKIPCSQTCYNKNCDRFNGTCLSACTNQFYGEKCDKGIIGLYPLCKSIPTAIQHLPKGIAFIHALQ